MSSDRPMRSADMVAAAIRTVFAQTDAGHVHEQFETIAMMLGRQLPKVEAMMRDARDDLLAFTGFPVPHWRKIWPTTPSERVNRPTVLIWVKASDPGEACLMNRLDALLSPSGRSAAAAWVARGLSHEQFSIGLSEVELGVAVTHGGMVDHRGRHTSWIALPSWVSFGSCLERSASS